MATYAAYRHVELDNVGYGKKRVLKPPGGGSSDIFGAPPEEITSPRRIKSHNQSQLGSALFGDVNGVDGVINMNASSRCANKPGNDSYKRLFGPPDAPSIIPNARKHMRSNISLSGGISSSISSPSSAIATSPARSIASSRSSIVNGFAAVSNGSLYNDVTGGTTSCMPTMRNPITGDGIEVTPVRRIVRKYRDGNPITGTGYNTPEPQKNGPIMQNGTVSSNSSSGEKSYDSSPIAKPPPRTRVPPGGYSSGLW